MISDQKTRLVRLVLAISMLVIANTRSVYASDVPDALEAGWEGEKRCEKLHEDDLIRILRCTFPPNVGHERHSHPPSFTYVLSGGHVQITDANGTRQLESKTDQYRAAKPVEWHEGLNTGDTTLRYLIVEKKYQYEK